MVLVIDDNELIQDMLPLLLPQSSGISGDHHLGKELQSCCVSSGIDPCFAEQRLYTADLKEDDRKLGMSYGVPVKEKR